MKGSLDQPPVAVVEAEAGDPGHEVELGGPGVALHDRVEPDAGLRDRDVVLLEDLGRRIDAQQVEAHLVDPDRLGLDVLVVAHADEDRRQDRSP